MLDKTSQKILDAALELFAKDGYKATTTSSIAIKADFNELTVFRKFKTKQNLFDMVIQQNIEKFKNEYYSLMVDEDFEDPEEFLRCTLRKVIKLIDNNIELFRLTVFEKIMEQEPLEEMIFHLARYLEKNIPNDEIDFLAFTLTITASFIMLSNNKYLGRTSVDQEMMEEITINNFIKCI